MWPTQLRAAFTLNLSDVLASGFALSLSYNKPSPPHTPRNTHILPFFLKFPFSIPHHFTILAVLVSSKPLCPLKNCLEHYKAIKS